MSHRKVATNKKLVSEETPEEKFWWDLYATMKEFGSKTVADIPEPHYSAFIQRGIDLGVIEDA